jgi:L-fuconolactonase
LVNLN